MSSFSTDYLASFLNYEIHPLAPNGAVFSLARIERLLTVLGDPQKFYPVIHVVGTKGKGSTASFIAAMLAQAGLTVGLYTSPHLYDPKERIRVLGPGTLAFLQKDIFKGKISLRQIDGILKEIKPEIEKIRKEKSLGPLTFFEAYTAIAFFFFARQKVDVVVAEAGLGGRFDATNAANSDICVVTSISYDHTQVLGSTLKQIAQEKAAIIKPSTQAVFSAPQKDQARRAIVQQAKKFGLKVISVGRDVRYRVIAQDRRGTLFSLKGLSDRWPKLRSPLIGEHQVVNASLAAAVVEYFLKGRHLPLKSVIAQGMAKTRWPVRFEILSARPFIVADSAHNEDSACRLAQTVKTLFPRKRVILIFGASRDKDIKKILKQFGTISQEMIFTSSRHPRSFDFSKDPRDFLTTQKICWAKDTKEALHMAKEMAKRGDVILAAGSVFLAGEIRALCRSRI